MASQRGEVKGLKTLLNKLSKAEKNIEKKVEIQLELESKQLVNIIKLKMRNPSKGRTYKRGKKTHTASKAGDAPNIDTGRLVGSLTYKTLAPLVFEIGSYNVPYAFWLEFGTPRMEARPFLYPSYQERKEKIKQKIQDTMNKYLKKGMKDV